MRQVDGAWLAVVTFVASVAGCGQHDVSASPARSEVPTHDAGAPTHVLPTIERPPKISGSSAIDLPPIRGITIGPIENTLHPGVGYGTEACGRAMDVAKDLGATWVALTPFGRMASTRSRDVDPTFEVPFEENREAVGRAIDQAHARGLRVMLVPHLWLEWGGWRGEIEPGAPPDTKDERGEITARGRATDAAMRGFSASYRRFLLAWTTVAEAHDVELLSVGVELRSWVTSGRAIGEMRALIHEVRGRFHGLLTYSANWDDVDDTVVLGDLDVIGINAFYPLADHDGATVDELMAGGARVADKVHELSQTWKKPVIFTEVGYTTRPDPAIKPWLWPDGMSKVVVDEQAQADAYRAILASVIDEPDFAGFFVWRLFSDPDDVSQEAAWGFPPRGKLAELVVRDAFSSRWAADAWTPAWTSLGLGARGTPGLSWGFPSLPFATPSTPSPLSRGDRGTYGAPRR